MNTLWILSKADISHRTIDTLIRSHQRPWPPSGATCRDSSVATCRDSSAMPLAGRISPVKSWRVLRSTVSRKVTKLSKKRRKVYFHGRFLLQAKRLLATLYVLVIRGFQSHFELIVFWLDYQQNVYQVSRKYPLNELIAYSCCFTSQYLLWRVKQRPSVRSCLPSSISLFSTKMEV